VGADEADTAESPLALAERLERLCLGRLDEVGHKLRDPSCGQLGVW